MSCVRIRCENCDKLLGRTYNCCNRCGYITTRGESKFKPEYVEENRMKASLREHGILGWLKLEGKITKEDLARYDAEKMAETMDKYLS